MQEVPFVSGLFRQGKSEVERNAGVQAMSQQKEVHKLSCEQLGCDYVYETQDDPKDVAFLCPRDGSLLVEAKHEGEEEK